MLAAIRSGLLRGVTVSSRFRKREDGAAAVEFALVALPFFALMFAVIELSVFFFSSRYLEDKVFDVGRRVLTQQLNQASSCTDFQQRIRDGVQGWFDPAQLTINITRLNTFAGTGTPENLTNPTCSLGASGQTLLIEISYPYPFAAFRLFSGNSSVNQLPLRAATALRVE
jgi:Flp pilus assembly protein TadG